MVREVGVHDDDEVTGCVLQAVDVGGSESEFTSAGADLDALGGVDLLELGGDFLGTVGGAVVDDDEFPVEFAGRKLALASCVVELSCDVLLLKRLSQEPCYYGQVATLVVGGKEHRVLVGVRHIWFGYCVCGIG